jgi:hypothetical protein
MVMTRHGILRFFGQSRREVFALSTGYMLFFGAVNRISDPDTTVWVSLLASLLMMIGTNLSYLAVFDRVAELEKSVRQHADRPTQPTNAR